MRLTTWLRVALGVTLGATAVGAQTTITFPGAPTSPNIGRSFVADGYVFGCVQSNNGIPCSLELAQSGVEFAGEPALFSNDIFGITTLARVNGTSFDLFSASIAPLFGRGITNAVFEGFLAGGGTVTQTFAVDNAPTLTTATFAGFEDLTSVEFRLGGFGAAAVSDVLQITNIRVSAISAVPEPGSFLLFGTGLLFAVAPLRRKRPKAA